MPQLEIAGTKLKLVNEKEMYFPKNIRSYPLPVKVDGQPSEFRLTTGKGRAGDIRRYAHVRVDGKPMWCLLPTDLSLIEVDAKKVEITAPAPAKTEEQEAADELASIGE